MLRLPRTPLTPEQLRTVEQYLSQAIGPVFEGSAETISYLPFDPYLRGCLTVTIRTGCVSQGLETITRHLEDEKKGLDEVQRRTGQKQAERMSRLLFLANDGSDRFYRQVASLLATHASRLWAVRLDVPSETLASVLGAKASPAKAICIEDKKALGTFFMGLSEWLSSDPRIA